MEIIELGGEPHWMGSMADGRWQNQTSELEDRARVFTQSEQKLNITLGTHGAMTKDPAFMSSES